MPRHFDFGNNGDVQLLRVGHDLADILLRIEPAVAAVLAVGRGRIGGQPKSHAAAPRAHARQLRIFFDFDAPAVVVHEMPVERVELVHRHHLKQLFHLGLRKKMTADVQHQPAPAEARRVGDLHAGNLPVEILHDAGRKDFRRQELQQCLRAVKQAGGRRGADHGQIFFHNQFIPFRAKAGIGSVGRQQNAAGDRQFRRRLPAGAKFPAGGFAQPLRQPVAGVRRRRVGVNPRLRHKFERAFAPLHFLRLRDDGRFIGGQNCCREHQGGHSDDEF